MTGELTNLFISENLELRQQKSEDTTKFLEQQLETARQNLAEQEEKVRVYKDQHLGELPSQLTSNVQILSGLQSQLQSEEDGLNSDRQQNAYLQSMLEQSRALQRTTKTWGRHTGRNTRFGPRAGQSSKRNSPISARITQIVIQTFVN